MIILSIMNILYYYDLIRKPTKKKILQRLHNIIIISNLNGTGQKETRK